MANYLVTGGGGFIGSQLTHALLERGDTVRVIDDFSTGQRSNLGSIEGEIDLRVGSILNYDYLANAMKGIDFVLHHAAQPSVSFSIDHPLRCHEINATGTLHVLLAARDAGVQKVIYAGSSSAYGDTEALPVHEELPVQPISPYAAAKLAGEHACQAAYRVYGLPTIILRYFNIFGPNQDPNSPYSAVIPRFLNAMVRNEQPCIYGDGLQSRDFTYVANVVASNLLACEADESAYGNVINIACGHSYTLLDVVAQINTVLGTAIEPSFEPARPGDIRHSSASIDKAKALLGYTPQIDFKAGIRQTIERALVMDKS